MIRSPSKPRVNLTGRLKKFELLVVSCDLAYPYGEVVEDLLSPDVKCVFVSVPAVPEGWSRCGLLKMADNLLELVKAGSGFNGVLIDSFLDVGVDVAREATSVPVCGLFWPAVSMALLVGDRFGIVFVREKEDPSLCEILIRELAAKHGVLDKVSAIRVVDCATQTVLDACNSCAKLPQVSAVILAGHVSPELRKQASQDIPIISATLAGISAIEGLMRGSIAQSRKCYPNIAKDN